MIMQRSAYAESDLLSHKASRCVDWANVQFGCSTDSDISPLSKGNELLVGIFSVGHAPSSIFEVTNLDEPFQIFTRHHTRFRCAMRSARDCALQSVVHASSQTAIHNRTVF